MRPRRAANTIDRVQIISLPLALANANLTCALTSDLNTSLDHAKAPPLNWAGGSPVVAYLRHSMMVVLPRPFWPQMRVSGNPNSIVSDRSGSNSLTPHIEELIDARHVCQRAASSCRAFGNFHFRNHSAVHPTFDYTLQSGYSMTRFLNSPHQLVYLLLLLGDIYTLQHTQPRPSRASPGSLSLEPSDESCIIILFVFVQLLPSHLILQSA